MKNYVIINGVNSNTKNGLAINELPPITKPQMRTLTEEIDGRDGDIITKLGYSAYDKTITIGLWGTSYDVNDIIAFFNKEGIITFSNEPDKYYKFTMVNEIDIETLLRFKTASITFHCQPFKYPTEETPIEIEYEYVEQDNVESANMTNTEGDTSLKIDLKGNTSQYTTTGKNIFNKNATPDYEKFASSTTLNTGVRITNTSAIGTIHYCYWKLGKGNEFNGKTLRLSTIITSSSTENGEIRLSVFDSDGNFKSVIKVVSGTGQINIEQLVSNVDNDDDIAVMLLSNAQQQNVGVYIDYTNLIITLDNNDTSYEPYTGGQPSPSPSYPQQIHEVSGDNEVVVCGKNIFNSTIDNGGIDTTTGNEIVNYGYVRCGYIQVIGGEDISVQYKNDLVSGQIVIYEYDENKTYLGFHYNTGKTYTRTLENNTKYIKLRLAGQAQTPLEEISNVMVEYSSTPSTYEPYNGDTYELNLGTLKMRGIGTYEDYFVRNSGKNLIQLNDIDLNGNIYTDLQLAKDLAIGTYNFSGINISGDGRFNLYGIDENNTQENLLTNELTKNIGSGYSFTTTKIYKQVKIYTNVALSGSIMLESGSLKTTYEPYGTGQWCKYNAIGKVVLNGSENWQSENVNAKTNYYISLSSALGSDTSTTCISNYFTGATGQQSYESTILTNIVGIGGSKKLRIRGTTFATKSDFTTWLSTHNTQVDYILASPYLSLIEDTNLIEQLDNLEYAMSYEGQTNVSQTNDDKPFLMDLKAMKKDTNQVIVNNIGNTNSKPTIALEGTGDINIYLNGTQMLKATLTDKMTIDTTNLEAYNPDTMTLLNRQLIGDLSKFTLASGNNTIKMDGNLTKATITDYVRYL